MENSVHLPFEEWLLSERTLSTYQEQALEEHLQTCTACQGLKQSWGHVNHLFREAPQVTPKVNFTARWVERQAAARTRKQRRQAWIIFGILSVNAVVFLGLLAMQAWSLVNSPAQWLLIKMYFLTRYLSVVGFVNTVIQAISETTLAFPLVGLFFLVGVTSFLSVVWFVAYRQLTSQTRRVK
ncbi:MAG: anti-sigma factor family protein [Chloroflexota bacterium]